MVRFRLFGIPIEIQPWFWLVLALLGGAIGARSPEDLLFLALFILAGAISILVHELGHALTGRAFGASTAITLHAFGGFATFPNARFSRKQDFLVTAAGPAIQILLGLGAIALLMFVSLPTQAITHFVSSLAGISIFWAILNLLPVFPLDGGRLLFAVLGPRRQKLALQISLAVAVLVAVGMLSFRGISLFPLYLASFAFENWKALQELNSRGY